MLRYLIRKIAHLLEAAAHARRDAYLAASVDHADLERRIRCVDLDGET
ncbi:MULTISPECIES: DUF3563 family protein [Burkholderia cepacia complex]|nr:MULTISPECIES: DUF3563 family protein [Burkholderia cepacia complex]HDR9496241.1 DUF3563 family protein [Burkholderia stabilis]HDR9527801.1 DUF3563 family protein [Burkholderia stabilis]HDR9542812.1 DUF3563 family protein [Burkholderia stabilis]HDR9573047.1 DUF3563 family protein [Burkholderia stabilis]HDR9581261.1 DUF3563 family protein [Burkholderia stabilis]